MMQEVNPKETTRAYAFEMWMKAPMPMVTLFKTLDVTRLCRISRRRRLKFNMLMCWCIGRAASQVKEFYLLLVGSKLMRYDSIAVNTIVLNRKGEVSSCDIPYTDDLACFNKDYLRLTRQVAETCVEATKRAKFNFNNIIRSLIPSRISASYTIVCFDTIGPNKFPKFCVLR